jgi:hypothetical protein
MDTSVILVSDKATIRLVADILIDYSVWFAIDPYPNDKWAISVKAEAAPRLRRILDQP